MSRVSQLERQFREQTQKEKENITQLGKNAFQAIERDWREQLSISGNTLRRDILNHNQKVIDDLERDRRR
ncbi:MbeB family mobilization protein, partial [Shewanella algae]|uniref:MbeB family mobilization protein n=1 Tax=Shewanella algae TaxID=38313 RepID=UPI00313F119C